MRSGLFRAVVISFGFISIIFFPFVNDRFGLVKDTENLENRRLAVKPVFDVNHLDPYPVSFERYYNDTFALRSRIIYYFNIYKCILLKESPSPKDVIIGKKQWLFLAGNDIATYLGKDRLSENELNTFRDEFELRRKYLASKNCKFYVMIAPCKANVYPENIPHTYYRLNQQCWGEQLIEHMNKNSKVNMIDLFTGLKKIKLQSKQPLYFLLDNHWNSIGAFHAANIAIEDFSKQTPGLKQLSLQDYSIIEEPKPDGNIDKIIGYLSPNKDVTYKLLPHHGNKAVDISEKYFLVPDNAFSPQDYENEKEIKNSDQPRLLIFSDSFGYAIYPFLAENFSRTTKIFGDWNYIINKDIVEKDKPDIVLLIVHEPLIRNILQHLTK